MDSKKNKNLVVYHGGKYIPLRIKHIICIEADRSYCKVYFFNKSQNKAKCYTCSCSKAELMQQLEQMLVPLNRSVASNPRFVAHVTPDGMVHLMHINKAYALSRCKSRKQLNEHVRRLFGTR